MIPMLAPQRIYQGAQWGNAQMAQEIEAAALRVLRSGQFILGPEVEAFEEACAEYLETKFALGVSSGTDALVLALMTLGIGQGDEVIVPSFTFFATAGAVARVGAIPVFVDILPDCYTMDPVSIERAITERTKAIIPVHLFGQASSMKSIQALASANNLHVIEDAAQAIGCEYDGKKVGTIGTIGCFSFFPSKNLGGFGDAGLVTTNDSSLAKELKIMRVHGGKQQYIHERVGGNFRIDALQAAMLNVKLEYSSDAEEKRIEHANRYLTALSECKKFVLPLQVRGKHVYNQFTLRVLDGKRDELQSFLKDKEIGCAVYYPKPLHMQDCFEECFEVLPVTMKASQEVLSIPVAPELTDQEISTVIDALLEFEED